MTTRNLNPPFDLDGVGTSDKSAGLRPYHLDELAADVRLRRG